MYEYKAKVIDVHDGDTMTCEIQLGFFITITHRIRLLNVDAFETKQIRGNTADMVAKGLEIRDILKSMLTGQEVLLHTVLDKSDKYGRFLADMYYGDLHINTYVREKGYDQLQK